MYAIIYPLKNSRAEKIMQKATVKNIMKYIQAAAKKWL